MLDVELAKQLKAAGLAWKPSENDCFVIPDRLLEGQIFVVNQLPALVQTYQGQQMVTFHSSSEWALDDILLSDTVWLPSECQLREALAGLLDRDAPLKLERLSVGYSCVFGYRGRVFEFRALTAEAAYAQALLALLRHELP